MKKNYINVFLYSLILFSIYCSLTIGLSWDELAVVEISKSRLKYLFSLGAVDYKSLWFSKFYPGTYGVTVMFFSQLFPKSYETDILHIFNSLIGISTIFGISKIAKELFNKKIGYIVFVISFFNPIFFGHMAMNERDLVIAFCNIWMTYSLLKYFKYYYIKKKRNNFVIILGLLLGLGLSCRISFIITLLPIFVFLTIDLLFIKKICKEKLLAKRFIKDILISVFIAYFILIIFWPEVYPNIFVLPFQFFNETLKKNLLDKIFSSFKNFQPTETVILSWTLSPQEICEKYEATAPPLHLRLKSLKHALESGWPVRLCFDPVLFVNGWEEIYGRFIDMVFQEIKGEQLLDVTVGVFRMNKDYFKRIKKRETRSDLFYSDYALESNTVTVPINQRRPALSHLKNRIANHIPINRILIWG